MLDTITLLRKFSLSLRFPRLAFSCFISHSTRMFRFGSRKVQGSSRPSLFNSSGVIRFRRQFLILESTQILSLSLYPNYSLPFPPISTHTTILGTLRFRSRFGSPRRGGLGFPLPLLRYQIIRPLTLEAFFFC